jgi:glutamyl/glutaminyl-tRNA synthetase
MASNGVAGPGSRRPVVTRFAPSSIGFLLFGNAGNCPQADIASYLPNIGAHGDIEKLDAEAKPRFGEISAHPGIESDWTIGSLEANLKAYAEELGLGLGKLAQPLRAALTGHTTSPGIFDVLALLGREESLARIDAQAAG